MEALPNLPVPHTVRTLIGADALEVLTRHWPALYTQDLEATPFQSPAWLTGAARLLPATATPLVLAATTASGRIIAALALVRDHERNHHSVRFRPLSAPHLSHLRLTGPHCDDDAVARGFALHLLFLQETGADISLPGLHGDTAFGRAVQAVCPDSLTTGPSPAVLVLPFSFEALASSRQRAHARRCRHWAQLAATHTITYRRSHHQRALRAGLKVLTTLHQAARSRPGAGTAVPWHRVMPAVGAAGAFAAELHVDDTPVAAQLCLTRGHACYSVEQVTHPGYRHVAPGHALLRHLLDDLAQEGFHTLHAGCGPAASAAPGPPIRLAA
ncbi:GNAT family N-acetyltransferase [Streptomyces sp. NPDC057620]|uniref:GNAT family N-acetyltransferase n=1 Tax=Streptomyces sp. NPDC057620 TaxID=3346185 RepID=UPI003675DE64